MIEAAQTTNSFEIAGYSLTFAGAIWLSPTN
jgi:hypothetical protein